MKNKMSDLRNHMFAALERLNNEELTKEELEQEITRCQAISEVGKVVVDSAKTEAMYLKALGNRGARITNKFINEDEAELFIEDKKPERAPAEYSNTSPMRIANTGM